LGPSYFVLWNFIPSYTFDGLLCRTWPFSPPNRLTLRITYCRLSFSNIPLCVVPHHWNRYDEFNQTCRPDLLLQEPWYW
jgi:hypothetical protein